MAGGVDGLPLAGCKRKDKKQVEIMVKIFIECAAVGLFVVFLFWGIVRLAKAAYEQICNCWKDNK